MISFSKSKCSETCLVIDSNPLCKDFNSDFSGVRNKEFTSDLLSQTIYEWSLTDMFILSGSPGTGVLFTPGNNTGKITQTGIDIISGSYRAYYSFTQIVPGGTWSFGFEIIGGTGVILAVNNSTEATQQGYVDFAVGASPPTKDLELIFNADLDTRRFRLNYFFICKTPAFNPEKNHGFQLPMYEVTGENLLPEIVGLNAPNTADHTGDAQRSLSFPPPPGGVDLLLWDNINVDFPIGYEGLLLFKYRVGGGSVAWGTDVDLNPKTVDLVWNNGTLFDPLSVSHITSFNPLKSLTGCFVSDKALTTPIIVDDCELYVRSFTEEDSSTNPLEVKIDYLLSNIDTELFEMRREYVVPALDNTFYRLRFKLNNTSNVSILVKDSSGTVIFQSSQGGRDYDAIFQTGVLPVPKDLTIIFEFQDILDCGSPDFYLDLATDVSLIEVDKWDAWIETNEPDFGTFIDYIPEEHAETNEDVGFSFDPYVFYCIDTTILEPGCYKVRIFGNGIGSQYVSQCLSVCAFTSDLNYFEWNHRNVVCLGTGVLDYTNYGGKGCDRHLWIKSDLQDLSFEENREVYKRSDGFSQIVYVESFGVETLQIWKSPDYARFAFVLMMSDTFQINGVSFQKLSDEPITPLFNFDPESVLRILIQKVGQFMIAKNI